MTFRLVKHDATGAYFGGLTFRRVDENTMEGYLALRNRDGSLHEEKSVYHRGT